jgi:two-component system response regulator RegX3
MRELVARARAQLRCRGWQAAGDAEIIDFDNVRVEVESRRALVGGQHVHLTAKEFEVLVELMRHAGRAVSRQDLLDRVWGGGYRKDAKTLDVHVRRVRDKIENDGPRLIHTVRGLGFRYDPLHQDADAIVVD